MVSEETVLDEYLNEVENRKEKISLETLTFHIRNIDLYDRMGGDGWPEGDPYFNSRDSIDRVYNLLEHKFSSVDDFVDWIVEELCLSDCDQARVMATGLGSARKREEFIQKKISEGNHYRAPEAAAGRLPDKKGVLTTEEIRALKQNILRRGDWYKLWSFARQTETEITAEEYRSIIANAPKESHREMARRDAESKGIKL